MQYHLGTALVAAATFATSCASADGIVARVVSAPLSAVGLVRGAPTGINILLVSDASGDGDFMDPRIEGFGFPAGGHVEIEMGEGFARIAEVEIAQPTVMVVTGAPQQGMPGQAVGYTVSEGDTAKKIVLTPDGPDGIPVENMRPPAPGAAHDPVPNRGAKVLHVGLIQSAFRNTGDNGTVHVRFIDHVGDVVHEGSGSADFLAAPEPQIFLNNFPDASRNHNWQIVTTRGTLGKDAGTVPLPYMIYETPATVDAASGAGLTGVGVLSAADLATMEAELPPGLERFADGLLLVDRNGDARLDPAVDKVIGGVTITGPDGATGHELRSFDTHGAPDLSRPAPAYNPMFGPIFGGAVGLLQFTAGDVPGNYYPTVAVLRDPADPSLGDSAVATWTVRVE